MKSITRLALLLSLPGLTGAFLHGQDAAATPDQELAKLREDNKNLSAEVASAWKEVDGLKAKLADSQKETQAARADAVSAQTSVSTNADEIASLRKQLDDAKSAPTTPGSADDMKKDLDDTKEKLEMSLHSYTLLQDENAQLKDQISKGDGEKAMLASQLEFANQSIASLKVQAAIATQVDSLRTQLRNSQDEVASLAGENEKLRTQLALNGTAPGTVRPSPNRPGSVVPTDLTTPAETTALVPSGAKSAMPPAPAADTPAKTYTVAEGDTLSRISKKFYGTTSKWETILNANREKLKNDKGLQVGMTLTIP